MPGVLRRLCLQRPLRQLRHDNLCSLQGNVCSRNVASYQHNNGFTNTNHIFQRLTPTMQQPTTFLFLKKHLHYSHDRLCCIRGDLKRKLSVMPSLIPSRSLHVNIRTMFCLNASASKVMGGLLRQNISVGQWDRNSMRLHGTKATTEVKPKTMDVKAKVRGIQKDISPLTTRRIIRKKKTKGSAVKDKAVYDAMAFATAEEINLESLIDDLKEQGLYEPCEMPKDLEDVLQVEAKYRVDDVPREIFFFREGSVVFWNMPEFERNAVFEFLRRHQTDSYDLSLVQQEFEHTDFTFTEGATNLVGDEIHLQIPKIEDSVETQDPDVQFKIERHNLEKYTFSNALALSVKLSIWEESLARYVDSIEWVLEDMKAGKKIRMKREEVLRKSGELFTLRHLINLSSDLLDTPDFYWDREHLEQLYLRACNHLSITRRTKIMNEKLNYCGELADLLTGHLNDRHHTRLEWMIIILITFEVIFEILRYCGELLSRKVDETH